MCMMLPDALASGRIRGLPGYEIQTPEEGKELTYAQREANWAKGGLSWHEAFDGKTPTYDRNYQTNPKRMFKFDDNKLIRQQNLSNIAMRESRRQLRGGGELQPRGRISRPAPSPREVEEVSATPQAESLRGKATVQDDAVKQKQAKKARGVAETKRGVKKLKAISPKSLPSSSGINI